MEVKEDALMLTEASFYAPHGYQDRPPNFIKVESAPMRRFCRGCNTVIPKKQKHASIESHLSSGRRSDIRLCNKCIIKLAKELQ